MKMYTVFDSQLGLYTKPYYARNKGEALRSFEQAVNDPDIFGKIAEHLTLFEVGDFNEETSKIHAYDSMVSLGCGIEWVKKKDTRQGNLFDVPPSSS
ncbi:DNA binding protein vP5 [Microviridae sp.]|nr:DNA binding protein vP5 [Microviridae sp.]